MFLCILNTELSEKKKKKDENIALLKMNLLHVFYQSCTSNAITSMLKLFNLCFSLFLSKCLEYCMLAKLKHIWFY